MKRLLLAAVAGLFVVLTTTTTAQAADFRSDPRVIAAVAEWKTNPVYVDPLFAGTDEYTPEALRQVASRIAQAPVPVYVAAVPAGEWFPEKDDEILLAGWLATANAKPGIYIVLGGRTTSGVPHLTHAWSPRTSYARADRPTAADEVAAYLDEVKVNDRYDADPARTEPLPPEPERTYTPERFTPGKAISNGLGGFTLGLLGGGILALPVLGLAALVARRRGGLR